MAALSITVLDEMLSFWGDPTPVLLWGDTRAAGTPLVLVISVSILAAGTAISRLLFAFLKKGVREGPAKALAFFAALCLALAALAWNGALTDLARAVTVGVGGSFLLSLPGALVFLRTREREEQRARQEEAERRQKEEEESARRAAREHLERERQEERRQEEARRARAEQERAEREQEQRRREHARRSKGSRESSREGGSRRGGRDQGSTGDRGRDRRGSASPQTRTAHEVLGIAPEASDGEIVAAYREKVRMYHPDKVSDLAPEYAEIAEREMKEINAAYAKLKPKKRT